MPLRGLPALAVGFLGELFLAGHRVNNPFAGAAELAYKQKIAVACVDGHLTGD